MSAALLLGSLLGFVSAQPEAAAPCPVQPLQPAIDVLGPAPTPTEITFSATPSLEVPGRAWVVRLSRSEPAGPAAVEIVRLRRQSACNRYDIEARWQSTLPAPQFNALAQRVLPFAAPSAGATSGATPFGPGGEVAVDGTGISLRMATAGWEVTRQLHASGASGAPLSLIFHDLVEQHVPATEHPTESWQTRRR